MKRSLDMIVLSGINLGSSNSEIEALQQYLDHVNPKAIVLNGSFIKNSPQTETQLAIIQTLTEMAEEGTRIYFIANNASLALQAYPEFFHRNIYFENNLTLRLKGKKYLFFNDNFTKKHLKLTSSDLSAKAFAEKALEKAIKENADYIVCGHNCVPNMKLESTPNRPIMYLHSGSWQKHLSALEYQWGCWSLYEYEAAHYQFDYHENEVIWGSSDTDILEHTDIMAYY